MPRKLQNIVFTICRIFLNEESSVDFYSLFAFFIELRISAQNQMKSEYQTSKKFYLIHMEKGEIHIVGNGSSAIVATWTVDEKRYKLPTGDVGSPMMATACADCRFSLSIDATSSRGGANPRMARCELLEEEDTPQGGTG
jgi:hypothetical protein